MTCSKLLPLLGCVISRIRSLNRSIAFGAILRFSSFPPVKLNPRNFRSCGFTAALFDSFTLTFSFSVNESRRPFHHPLPRARSVRRCYCRPHISRSDARSLLTPGPVRPASGYSATDQLLLRIGDARKEAGRAFGLVKIQLPRWTRYVQLTQIKSVFRSLKSELGVRPIYHRLEHRAGAHILVAFLAYCLQVTLKNRLMIHAPGLTPATDRDWRRRAMAKVRLVPINRR